VNRRISAVPLLFLGACGGDDTIGTGLSGWIIGALVGLFLLGLVVWVWGKRG